MFNCKLRFKKENWWCLFKTEDVETSAVLLWSQQWNVVPCLLLMGLHLTQETSRPSEPGSRHSPPLHHIQRGSENRCQQDWRVPGRCSGPTQVSVTPWFGTSGTALTGDFCPKMFFSINKLKTWTSSCLSYLPPLISLIFRSKAAFSVRLFLNYPFYIPLILSALSDCPFWWQAQCVQIMQMKMSLLYRT